MKLVDTADIKLPPLTTRANPTPASGVNDDQSLAQASTAGCRSFF
jgi:hypothetical protein